MQQQLSRSSSCHLCGVCDVHAESANRSGSRSCRAGSRAQPFPVRARQVQRARSTGTPPQPPMWQFRARPQVEDALGAQPGLSEPSSASTLRVAANVAGARVASMPEPVRGETVGVTCDVSESVSFRQHRAGPRRSRVKIAQLALDRCLECGVHIIDAGLLAQLRTRRPSSVLQVLAPRHARRRGPYGEAAAQELERFGHRHEAELRDLLDCTSTVRLLGIEQPQSNRKRTRPGGPRVGGEVDARQPRYRSRPRSPHEPRAGRPPRCSPSASICPPGSSNRFVGRSQDQQPSGRVKDERAAMPGSRDLIRRLFIRRGDYAAGESRGRSPTGGGPRCSSTSRKVDGRTGRSLECPRGAKSTWSRKVWSGPGRPAALRRCSRVRAVQLDTIRSSPGRTSWSPSRLGPIGRAGSTRGTGGRRAPPSSTGRTRHASCSRGLARLRLPTCARKARGHRWHRLEDADKSCSYVATASVPEGPLSARELGGAKKGGPWWDWSETKIAAEWLLDMASSSVVSARVSSVSTPRRARDPRRAPRDRAQ